MDALRRALSLPLLCRDNQTLVVTPGGAVPRRRLSRQPKTTGSKDPQVTKKCSRFSKKVTKTSANRIHPSGSEDVISELGNHGDEENSDDKGIHGNDLILDPNGNQCVNENIIHTSEDTKHKTKISDIRIVHSKKPYLESLFAPEVLSDVSSDYSSVSAPLYVTRGGCDVINSHVIPMSCLDSRSRGTHKCWRPVIMQPKALRRKKTCSSVDLMSLYETITQPEPAPDPPPPAVLDPRAPQRTVAMADVAPPSVDCDSSDPKKRPLSVSSTSSSSSSSLPRQPRKKVAASTTIEEWGDDLHGNQQDGGSSMDNSDSLHDSLSHAGNTHAGNTSISAETIVERVVAEILETENKYVADMKDIIQGYLQFILVRRERLQIPDEDIMALFGNIEDIYQFNSEFLSLLDQCSSDPIHVAQCFVQEGQGFLVYADYCTNYPRAVEVLTKCMRDHRLADTFKHQQMALQHGLPLGSYLLKPVQRILKYHLLLQNMLNHYTTSDPGHQVIQRALASMTKMADTINAMKRKHERMVHVQEIQSMLYGWEGDDLTTFGDLVIEDSFRMYGAKAHRLMFLFEKGLFIAKRKEDGTLQLKDTILCSNLMLIESIPKEPLSFHVIPFDNPRLQYTVQAKSLDQKRSWCQELKHLILENYSAAIPEKARELVMMLGKSRDEEGIDTSRVENPEPVKKTHNAPEYLERRRGRRKSTSLIPDFGLLKSKKSTRKSESGSPNNSPRLRRRSDIANFPPKSRSKSHLHGNMEEEEEGDLDLDDTEDGSKTPDTEHVRLRERSHNTHTRLLRSQSRSLESLQDAMATNGNHGNMDAVGSYDDASYRAHQLSQALSSPDEVNLDLQESCDDENNVISVINMPPATRDPMGRVVSRVDSILVAKMRKKYIKQASAPSFNTLAGGVMDKDDGYVNVAFSDSAGYGMIQDNRGDDVYSNVVRMQQQCSIQEEEEGTSDDSYGNYVKLNISAGSRGGSVAGLPDVVRSHCITDSPLVRDSSRDSSDAALSKCDSPRNSLRSGATSPRFIVGSVPGSPVRGHMSSPHSPNRYLTKGGDSALSSCASLSTGKPSSPIVRDNSFREQGRTLSTQVLSESVNIPFQKDPWVPRSPEPTNEPSSRELASNVSSPRSGRSRLRKDKKIIKSSSFTSTDDLLRQQELLEDAYVRGHRRQKSDTMVFSNRRAFLASSSAATNGITRDQELQRRICRLATPPREMGPEDLVQEIEVCRERGRVVARYATPPRQSMEPGLISKPTVPSEAMAMPRSPVSPRGGPSSAVSCDGVLTQQSWSPDSTSTPLPGPKRINPHRPGSFHGTSVHSTQNRPLSPLRGFFSPQSPSSPTSSESIVESLKHVMQNITSRLTGRSHGPTSPKSVGSSPSRTPRARSAEDMFRIDRSVTPDSRSSSKHGKEKGQRKDKKDRFVYQLARAYSERVKGKSRNFLNRHGQEGAVKKELKELLRDNKPGSLNLGERIATSKPIVLGTYTLPRHRPPRPKKNQECSKVNGASDSMDNTNKDIVNCSGSVQPTNHDTNPKDAEAASSMETSAELDKLDSATGPDPGVDSLLDSELMTALRAVSEHSGLDTSDDCDTEFFYEQRFVEDLESGLPEGLCDSALYSDDGAMSYVDTDSAPHLKMSIKDTVKLIEHRYRSKPVPRIEVKNKEKGHGMHQILRSLENSAPGSPTLSPDGSSASSNDVTFKTVRERTRELMECATLTRIRQNSYSYNLSDDYAKEEVEDNVEGRSKSAGASPTKKGLGLHCS